MNSSNPPANRIRLRFGLKSCIIGMLLLGVLFAWIAKRLNHARHQSQMIAEVLKVAGTVGFDYQLGYQTYLGPPNLTAVPPGPAWLRAIIGDEPFRSPIALYLRGDTITDAFIAKHLAKFTELKVLSIESPNVTDKALSHVARLHSLEALDLNCPQVTPAGIRQLNELAKLVYVRSVLDARNVRLMRSLEDETHIEVEEVPLSDLLDYSYDLHKTPFEFDDCVRRDQRNAPVTELLTKLPLNEALTKVLEPRGLGYFLRAGAIVVTSQEEAKKGHAGSDAFRTAFPNLKSLTTDW